ncbi:MAG: glutamate racemase [Oscillospiraceae bacterium]
MPYGGRSAEILLKYARQDVRFLRSHDIKAILVACGTVSTTALPQLRQESDIPILGVVEPACRRAAAVTRNRRVGLIATAASVRSGAYQRSLRQLDPDIAVTAKACPLFVPLVENGRFRRGDVVIETVAREYLEPLRREGLDTLILGCTHYPLLTDIIGDIMGPGVTLITPARRPPGSSSAPCGPWTCWPRRGRPAGPPSAPATSPSISGPWRPIS